MKNLWNSFSLNICNKYNLQHPLLQRNISFDYNSNKVMQNNFPLLLFLCRFDIERVAQINGTVLACKTHEPFTLKYEQ